MRLNKANATDSVAIEPYLATTRTISRHLLE